MRITPFEPRHAALLALRPMDARVLAGMGLAPVPSDLEALGRSLVDRGPAFTAWAGPDAAARPLACAGLAELWSGAAEAWALTSPLVETHALGFHRAATRMLPAMASQLGLVRIQATVLADHGQGRRWLERLGFVRETIEPMRRYVGGDDYHLYALLPGGRHPNPRS